MLVSDVGARKNGVREGYLLAPATQAKCGRGWRAMFYFFCHPLLLGKYNEEKGPVWRLPYFIKIPFMGKKKFF